MTQVAAFGDAQKNSFLAQVILLRIGAVSQNVFAVDHRNARIVQVSALRSIRPQYRLRLHGEMNAVVAQRQPQHLLAFVAVHPDHKRMAAVQAGGGGIVDSLATVGDIFCRQYRVFRAAVEQVRLQTCQRSKIEFHDHIPSRSCN